MENHNEAAIKPLLPLLEQAVAGVKALVRMGVNIAMTGEPGCLPKPGESLIRLGETLRMSATQIADPSAGRVKVDKRSRPHSARRAAKSSEAQKAYWNRVRALADGHHISMSAARAKLKRNRELARGLTPMPARRVPEDNGVPQAFARQR